MESFERWQEGGERVIKIKQVRVRRGVGPNFGHFLIL